MKRNSLFMWSYISFISVCIFLRLFFDYQLWAPLVLAITISSVFFSIEDLFTSLWKAIENSCNIAEDYSNKLFEDIKYRLSFFDKVDEKANLYEGTKYNISDLRDSLIPILKHTNELLQGLKERYSQILSKKKTQKRYQQTANISAYFGFLILFCTLMFSAYIDISVTAQEIITVFSFSIILLTHQLNISLSRKLQDEIINYKSTLHTREEEKELLLGLEEKLNYLTELIDLDASEAEEPTHAD